MLSHLVLLRYSADRAGWLTLRHKGIGSQEHTEETKEPPNQVGCQLPPVHMRGALSEARDRDCGHLYYQTKSSIITVISKEQHLHDVTLDN